MTLLHWEFSRGHGNSLTNIIFFFGGNEVEFVFPWIPPTENDDDDSLVILVDLGQKYFFLSYTNGSDSQSCEETQPSTAKKDSMMEWFLLIWDINYSGSASQEWKKQRLCSFQGRTKGTSPSSEGSVMRQPIHPIHEKKKSWKAASFYQGFRAKTF